MREPNLSIGRDGELAVALSINQDLRLDSIIQIGMVIFKDGEFEGYQMSGKTDSLSQAPVMAADGEGNLHLAWREGAQGSLAYYAVTTAEGRDELDRLQANDVANVALSGGMEVVTGVLFFPLACIWLVPGMIIIGLWHLWRGDSDLNNTGTIIVLILAIAVSQVMKFLFLPTITTYVPFSAWLDVSPGWQQPLLYIVPLLTMFDWFTGGLSDAPPYAIGSGIFLLVHCSRCCSDPGYLWCDDFRRLLGSLNIIPGRSLFELLGILWPPGSIRAFDDPQLLPARRKSNHDPYQCRRAPICLT